MWRAIRSIDVPISRRAADAAKLGRGGVAARRTYRTSLLYSLPDQRAVMRLQRNV